MILAHGNKKGVDCMAHEHPVRDTDLHFIIDPITRTIKNNSGKITLMQYDHQSEIFTFELPRYIDTHDMSICNKVRVHYINIGSSSKYEPVSGVYEIADLQIDPENEDLVTCSWLLTNNTTQLEGTLNFIIRFSCVTGETLDYSWSTAIYSGIVVSKTIDSTDEVMENTADILEQWKASLKGDPFTYEDFTPEQLEGLRGPAGIPGIVVSNDEPTASNHPVWLNPDGQIGGMGVPFYVNATADDDGKITVDKTFADVDAAYQAGRSVYCKISSPYIFSALLMILPLIGYISTSNDRTYIFSAAGMLDDTTPSLAQLSVNKSGWTYTPKQFGT